MLDLQFQHYILRINRLIKKQLAIYLLLLSGIGGCRQELESRLVIATASNMQFAMSELVTAFELESGIACDVILSSSGKLTAQIMEGAPYHVFVSADMKYPTELFTTGFAVSKPEVYALGHLVLWSVKREPKPSLEMLTDDRVKNIALANPKSAPYGAAAVHILEENGLYPLVQQKLVYGESIAQTNQFVLSGAAEVGFTALAAVLSPQLKEKGSWTELNESTYPPIAQGMVVIKGSEMQMQNAHLFQEFLFSDPAREILKRFGYSVPTP